MRLPLFIAFVAFSILPAAAPAEEGIRVAVADNQKTVTLKSASGLMMEGTTTDRFEKKMIFGSDYAGTRPVRVRSVDEFITVNGRSYRGWIELRKKKNGSLLVVNDLDIEEYLMGVIAEEIPHDWEMEALKAQAVASRTYALYQKKNSGRRPYHILSTVNGQVYSGRRGERESAVRAVSETRGMVLEYGRDIVAAFYHSSCGGHTEDASELWGINAPYLKGVDCTCQEISKYGVWEKRLSTASIARALGRRGYKLKDVISVGIGNITPAGRVRDVVVKHAGGSMTLPAETLRSAVGYALVPSVFFEIAVSGNDVVFSGRGLGHGVGLCQWGARNMARKGHDFKSILSHYYPGTRLVNIGDL